MKLYVMYSVQRGGHMLSTEQNWREFDTPEEAFNFCVSNRDSWVSSKIVRGTEVTLTNRVTIDEV